MVAVYFNGQQVGTMTVPLDVLTRLTDGALELRDDAGKSIRRLVAEPICPWDPSLTREEIDRIAAEPGGMSLADFWKKMGRS